MLLVPPVLLKMASTGYRFARYYTANPATGARGRPELALRVLAPMVVLSTVGRVRQRRRPALRRAVLPRGGCCRSTRLTFFVWLAFMALHVLGHLPEMPAVLRAGYGRSAGLSSDVTGSAGRMLALGGALVAGVVLAVLVIPEFGPWVHNAGLFHHHHH